MLGKVFQNIQQVGIQKQLCRSATRCKCVPSPVTDIKNHGSGLCKSTEFVHEYSTSTNKDAPDALQNQTKTWKACDALADNERSIVSNQFKIDDEAEQARSLVCPEKPCLKENLGENLTYQTSSADGGKYDQHHYLESRPEISTSNDNPNIAGSKHMMQKSRDMFEREVYKLTNVLQKQSIVEPNDFKLFQKRYIHSMERISKNEDDESDKVENLTRKELEKDNIVKADGHLKSDTMSLSGGKLTNNSNTIRKQDNVVDDNTTKLVSPGNEDGKHTESNVYNIKILPKMKFVTNAPLLLKNSQYVQAFQPISNELFLSDRIQNATDDLQQVTGDINLRDSTIENIVSKTFGSVQTSDVHKLRKNELSQKLYLSVKTPSDRDMRSSYSTSCEEFGGQDSLRKSEKKGCLGDLERKDSGVRLPDRCLSIRSISTMDTKTAKVDPVKNKSVELKGKQKKKDSKDNKDKGKKKDKGCKKKKKKKKAKKKKVCGHDTSNMSCLDVCHTRKPCGPKPKSGKKNKPQKCLVIGCPRGLRGICVKLNSVFKRNRKCNVKKPKRK